MIFTEETTLEHLCINYVGNQTHQEALVTTDTEVFITDEMKALLKDYFLKNFKPEIFFEFFHSSNIENNEVFTYVSEIFEQPELLENQSKKLAKPKNWQNCFTNILPILEPKVENSTFAFSKIAS